MPRLICIRCLSCSSSLTKPLELVDYSLHTDEVDQPCLPDGTVRPYLPVGTIGQEDGSYFNTMVGAYVTNVDACLNMSLTEDITRLYGCCGVGGTNGPNLLCDTCKRSVATKLEDCCTPHCVVFDPDATLDETIENSIA